MKPPVLGVDIGRVIIDGDGPDTTFLGASSDEAALEATAVAGAVDALGALSERFEGRVWLVSKCGPKIQNRTRAWLAHHRFFEITGIPARQLRFCRERKQKAGICLDLGIGLFVDDRVDVLHAMAGVVPYRFQFGATTAPQGIVPVVDWRATTRAIDAIAPELFR